jgi:hypothetical protein
MPLQPLVMLVLLAAVLTRALQHLVAEHHGGGLRLAFRHNSRRFGRRPRRRCQRRFNILRRGGGGRGRFVAVRTRPFPLFSVAAAALRAVAGIFLSLSAVFGRTGGGGEGKFVRAAAAFCGAAAAALAAFAALLFAAAQVFARLRLGGRVGAPPALPASLSARLRGVRKPEKKKKKGLTIRCNRKDSAVFQIQIPFDLASPDSDLVKIKLTGTIFPFFKLERFKMPFQNLLREVVFSSLFSRYKDRSMKRRRKEEK